MPRIALITASRGATRVIPRLHRPAQASSTNVYKELLEINQAISSVAVGLASAAVREALAALKAARPESKIESGGELTLADLLAAVRQAGSSVQETPEPNTETGDIDSVEKLGEALRLGDDEFDRALGIEASGAGEVFSDSRKWRTGKFSITRELR